jgi:uncharacterized LabA/DUF88 family protein
MPRPIPAYALVDWHNVQRRLSPEFQKDPGRMLPNALLKLQQGLARLLMHLDSTVSYRVVMRLYHGWHEGRETTPIRRIFERFAQDPNLARRISRVSFTPGFRFGNELACDSRLNPLYSTYRGGGQDTGQKMVDTAIACDLLHILTSGLADVGVVVSDDDDLVPAVFTAEAWKLRAILLREPEHTLDHISMEDCTSVVRYWNCDA